MIIFEEYQKRGGIAVQEEFDLLIDKAIDTIMMFVDNKVPHWLEKSSLEDYGFTTLDKAIQYQLDYLLVNDGINGKTEEVTTVNVEAFTVKYDASKVQYLNNIPFSPMAQAILTKEMRQLGLLNKAL